MAKEMYKNKNISILGDSISTFKGVIPERNAARYPQDNLVTELDKTWWKRVIDELGAILGVNDSWAGSQVSNILDKPDGNIGPDRCMACIDRIKNLGTNGTPDVIFLYGGTNDIGRALYETGRFLPTQVPPEVDLTSTKWNSFIDGYVTAVMRIKHFYPNAELIAMLPGYVRSYYTPKRIDEADEELIKLCQHFGIRYIDLRKCGITPENTSELLPDGLHPAEVGMRFIADRVIKTLTE